MAISSLLATIAFIGQHQLQARARFDEAVDKTIENIAYARDFAMSNVNAEGNGTNTGALLVGVGLEFDNNHLSRNRPITEMEPIYAQPSADKYADPTTYATWPPAGGGAMCPATAHPDDPGECWEQFFSLPDTNNFRVTNTGVAEVYYINTGRGLQVCQDFGSFSPSINAACISGSGSPIDLDVADADGYHTRIEIDPASGYAKRLY